jgi:hypothetical protein
MVTGIRQRIQLLTVVGYAGLIFRPHTASHAAQGTADTLRGSNMRGLKVLISTTVLLAGLAVAPASQGQVFVNIGVQPVCSYGYYGYAPYACAPVGYYGPGYFYNGIFLGMGPWGGWGYSHGWGGHRFVNEGGGSYHGGPGRVSYHASAAGSHSGGARPSAGHAAVSHASASHGTAHTATSHGGGEHAGAESHGGGGGHAGGGEHR